VLGIAGDRGEAGVDPLAPSVDVGDGDAVDGRAQRGAEHAQLLDQLLALAQVVDDADHPASGRRVDRRQPHVDRELGAVLAEPRSGRASPIGRLCAISTNCCR